MESKAGRGSGVGVCNRMRGWVMAAVAAAGGLLALGATPAQAAWPSDQPINMIVAYAPGGGTDLVARAIAPFIEKYLGDGAKITVINRTGAGGEIGFSALAAAAPDGYTIGFINTPNLITIPIERKTSYTWLGLDLLGNVVDDPGTFCVHNDSPVKSLADLAALAKSQPGKITVGSTGVGSDDHLAMLFFERIAGVKMNHIPFKGSADVRNALAGRQIDVAAINVGEALQYAKGGTPLRILGQMTMARSALAPDTVTFKEQGYPIELASLRGMAAPKGLPTAVRERLARAIERAVADPAFKVQADKFFAPLRYLAPARYEAELRDAEVQFRQLFKEMPWTDK